MKRRVLSFTIALALCLNLLPVGVFAADLGTGDGLCPHHAEHTDECGYVEGPPGAPCTFVCPICPMEELIGKLPSSVSEDNWEQVQAQIEEIYARYDELSADEQHQVDLSPCAALLDQVEGMGAAELSTADSGFTPKSGTILESDMTLDYSPYPVSQSTSIDTDKYTLTGLNSSAIQVTSTGALDLRGNVVSQKGAGVEVQSGGTLYLREPINITGTTYALDIAAGATVRLAPGTYSGGIAAICVADGDYAALLGEGCAYLDDNGNAITPENLANAKTLTVGQCTSHSKAYDPNAGSPTHTWTCAYCGTTEEQEKCTFTFDQSETGTCSLCGNKITVEVNRDSLKELAYDNTVQPANGTVTVKVAGAAAALTAGTDYTVAYQTRADVGNASFTVTVTVTGKAYYGTFTQDYTFTKAELEKPVLQWETTDPVAVDYTGSAVTRDKLPGVQINITSSQDLSQYLQYSYRQGDAAYTDGLPTNAGTYEVVVTLPEEPVNLPDYQAASSEPITLTVKPIDPIVAAPAPATPTYNGAAQELVTAGTLNPVAVADGLEIQFATSESGPFSTDIPTGTDAGDSYRVWYRVTGLTGNYITPSPNPAQVSDVKILSKSIKPRIELSQSSYLYDGTKKNPQVTVKDGDTVLREVQDYTVTWAGTKSQTDADMLRVADTYTATITNVANGNYTFTATASVEIVPADQVALHITGQPEHVYYGDTVTTLGTTGGTGEGTVKWSVTAGNATIEESTGKLTITGTGAVTVRAERTVPNYGKASDTWTFNVEPKPVTAEVTVAAKTYDGTTAIDAAAITAQVKAADLVTVNGTTDTVAITGLTGTYTDPNVGTGKTVTLDSTGATATGTDAAKYTVSYPATATGDINPRDVTVTVTLSDHDLKTDNIANPPVSYYEYDGTAKTPAVTVTGTDGSYSATLAASDYDVAYANNKNVSTTTVKASVTVTAKAGGNYTFNAKTVNFEIRSAGAVLTSNPQAKDLTYEKGTEQELVTVGTATGGTVVYSLTNNGTDYKAEIPKKEAAGTYIVYYKVKADGNHADTAPASVSVTIKPKTITPAITLTGDGLTETNGVYSYSYDGTAKKPTVTVKDGTDTIDAGEYTVSYRDNVNVGTATVVISDKNGGNYIVNGTATFEIAKKAPTFTPPTGKDDLHYTGELQDLVNAGICSEGTVVYSVNGGNYSAAIPTASAVGTYNISWKVLGDANHSDTTPATLTVKIDKNTVNNPTITLSQNQFTYNGSQQKPTIAVYDDHSRLIPEHEYTVDIQGTNNNVGMVDVDTYTVTIAAAADSNYVFTGTLTRTFKIVPADQETISITGTQAQVRYGDTIQLGVSGGTGGGTVKWEITGNTATTLTQGGLLTVKDVNTPITVTVTRSRANYDDVSASWEFTAAKKSVTADVTVAAKDWDGTTDVAGTAITATVKAADLAFTGDNITITGLTGTYDSANVGTGKTVTLTGGTVGGTHADKYDVTIPATATASILAVAATVVTEPTANTLTYDASQAQALITAGSATGGTMAYSLDGNNFTPAIPKGKDAGKYTVYYKAQGDQNHTDSAVDTVDVTITQQTVTPQIELSPPSGQYDGKVQQPAVTVRDDDNNVIPASEYKVTYDTESDTKDWMAVGTYTVKVENISGGNYVVDTATKDFTISTSAQAPLEIVNKPGQVYYGDTFTLSATGGSGNQAVTWSVDTAGASVVNIGANGLVKVIGVGQATITATKTGGGNYDTATATYPLNALKKPVTAIVTADDKVFDGNTNATIHVAWKDGDLINGDAIDTSSLSGAFEDADVGTNKKVTITGTQPTSDKYDFTIPATTTASITKAVAATPSVKPAENLEYNHTAQNLVKDGDTNTLYSASRDGVYSSTVPTGTNAGTYTIWYKAQGDTNHNESVPQSISVTISPKTLTVDASNVELSGNDLKTDTSGTGKVYYYEYDGTDKTPTVTIKDGAAVIPASEYTVTYSNNKNVTPDDKKATVTITDNQGGNYAISVTGTVSFEIRAGGAQLTKSPEARTLTYTGAAQELVTVGTATGGHIEYALTSAPAGEPILNSNFSASIPTGTKAGAYTVDYKVVGDDNHNDGPTGSVTVTIKPKEVISPKITVAGTYIYNGNEQKPTGTAVTVEDGNTKIPDTEYTLSYQNNVNAGTATVIVADNNGGNYTVNGSATFEIGTATAAVGTAPTGETGLKYNGTAQELLDTLGTATGGTLVYSLTQNGEYSAAIPTGKTVGEYEIWYKVLGDSNHSDSTAVKLAQAVKIDKNTVTNPTIQVTPPSVKYTGEKQEPTVTVRDDDGLLIDGSEYTATYEDTTNNNTDLTAVGTYTVTITGVTNGNYTFNIAAGADPVTFTITPADQTPLTITGTWERIYYGDTIPLGTTGGISGGTVTWKVNDGAPASINANTGLLKITGVGSVTVTATSTKPGYNHQTATWALYAEKKPVTAVVTANAKDYDGTEAAAVTATLQTSDFVGTDSFTITLTGCTFEDPNAGTDKKVNVDSSNPTFTVNAGGTDNHENYAITYPATATASISKADIEATDVTAPTTATGLTYTGLPQALITAAGTVTGGTMEYSTDGETYSTRFPTGTDAGDYDVWYRVKGDGNHNDTAGTKLTSDTSKVTIARQTVDADKLTIEFNPSGATYDGQEHKPEVIVKDSNGRVIPAAEYTVGYGSTNWKDVGDHTVTITGKTDGNYSITGTPTETFTILPAGQSPLSIAGQPGTVQYGDVFTLSANGGSGTGAVTWESSDNTVAFVNSQNGRVEIKKAGGPVTITARKAAGGGYGETTATWTFSAEKRPATAIVTARNKPYNGSNTATVDVTWKDGDLLNGDTITLSLTGAFDDANVGTDKIVRITGTAPNDDRYVITIPPTTTASITATQATVSGVQSGPWTYSGSEISLLQGGAPTHGTIVYSRNGVDFMETAPTETNAGRYTVYYKARGNTNYADSDVRMVEVTIQPRTVTSPTIELSSNSVTYDGTEKEPEVVSVKDGSNVIPASEYTVSYRNNISVGTATVTITDVAGGNYTVSGSRNFTITAGAASLVNAPQPNNRTYDGSAQPLVTAGSAVNGKVVYSLTQGGGYSTSIPVKTDADTYTVWYKVQGENGGADTTENYVTVTISRKPVTPTILVGGQSSYSVTYTGSAQTPAVAVSANGQTLTQGTDYTVVYSNNTEPGTATVTITSIGGNYQFTAQTTFTIAKAKAAFLIEPEGKTGLVYTGQPQELIEEGTGISLDGIVLYSTDAVNFSAAVPTATKVSSRHLVIAKVQGNATHADSDPVVLYVEIAKNNKGATVTLEPESTNFPYTGSAQRPPVTVLDSEGNVIDGGEYTLSYSDNINVGTATVTATSKASGNYSFTASTAFNIVDASQTPLTITGKKDAVYYGDTLTLGVTGGGSGTVTWSSSDTTIANIDTNGTIQKIGTSGSVTITATKGSSTDTWTFYAQPKPVTATVYAADKVYGEVYGDGSTVKLTVTLSGLVSGDKVAINTEDGVKATGEFTDVNVGTRTVIITLTVPDAVSKMYDITYNSTTTASITPKPASVTGSMTGKNLTYNGTAQALIEVSGVTVEGGNLAYSLDGSSYTFTIPTATDVGSYPVWYKVVASGENYKDSAPAKVTQDAKISANQDAPTVRCDPSSFPYDGTEKTPTVVVLDVTGQHIIPESEYTVTFDPGTRIAVGKYKVTVTDKPGGNYEFTSPVTVENAFEIVASSQAPLSITDKPAHVYYGDTFYLSATGGSGSGKIQWSIESQDTAPANITQDGAVTVTGTGSFTVKAYREASGGYSQSNTDSVTFEAKPKPVTPVVTASDKSYDRNTNATLTASLRDSDKVNSTDIVTLDVQGVFASPDAGVGKRVDLTGHTVGGKDADKYAINWPDSVTATINRVDAKITGVPTGKTLTYKAGTEQELVSAGTTENNIGTVVYSLNDQNGTYTESIPKATAVGKYTVWYKVADSVNYNGVPAASVTAEIQASGSGSDTPAEGTGDTPSVPPAESTDNTSTLPVSDTLTTTVQNGTANAVLSASGGNQLVKEAVKNQSDTIVIKPEITSDVSKTQVSIPASTVSQIQSETNAALTVASPIADVTIPNGALNTLSRAGGTVNVVTEQVGDAVALTLTADGKTVEDVPGGVTLTVPAEDAGPGTVAVLVQEDGTREVLQRSVVKDGKLSAPLSGSATVEIVDNGKSFADVPDTNWAAEAVTFASARELFNGTSETTFSPDETTSRGMVATVLYRLEGQPGQALTDVYNDVSDDAWYADSVAWAAENGIVNGYGDGQFGPNDSVTREQFVVMLWRYVGSPEANGHDLTAFTDADQINSYAQEALCWAVENGVLKGNGSGQLVPGGTATRAEAAQMLKNFIENT